LKARQITLIALFISLAIIVPMIFHGVGLGAMFLPMFLPVMLAGFIIDFPGVMMVGLFAPWLSALATGMPPLFPTALVMCVEGAVGAGVISYLYQRRKLHFWLCLITGVLAERLMLVVMMLLIVPLFHLPTKAFSVAALIYSLPGVALQLIFIPFLLKGLWRLKFLEQKL